jgi:nucleotide-binding universal stress UspA family protein
MYETVVVATDGSESVERAVTVAVDLAGRFDAELYALFVLDERAVADAPENLREDLRVAMEDRGDRALEAVADAASDRVTPAIREGRPAETIIEYARDVDADVVALGTRGRHGEGRFILGSVAESVVRSCPVPVLTVRQIEREESGLEDA